MEKRFNNVIYSTEDPVSICSLIKKLNIQTNSELVELGELLNTKLKNYELFNVSGGKIVPIERTSYRFGIFYEGEKESSYVKVDARNNGCYDKYVGEYVVKDCFRNGAMNGDLVLVDIYCGTRSHIRKARVEQIIKSKNEEKNKTLNLKPSVE